MSGHSKWHSIRHKKAATDAKRGKIWTKVAKAIAVAAKLGGDPEANPTLRLAIAKAKDANMPNDNITRAIKRGTGDDKDASVIEEILYEGYGPGGVAIMVLCMTDNKNRTVTNVRHIFSKNGGNLGEAGCVSYLFEKKGVITVLLEGKDPDETGLQMLDFGADDIKTADDSIEVYTDTNSFEDVKEKIKSAGFTIDSFDVGNIPQNSVDIDSPETAKKILKLMEALEDDDDVNEVSSNFDISEKIMTALA